MTAPRHAMFLLLLAVLLGSCSMFRTNNRRTLNWLDATFTPESTTAKVALVPVALPVGVLGFCADLAVVHPVTTLDDAWDDTRELLWEPKDESPLRRALFVPLAAAATPFVFVGDWFGRWFLPIDSNEPKPEDKK